MRFRKRLIEVEPAATLALVGASGLATASSRIDNLSGVRVREARQRHGKR